MGYGVSSGCSSEALAVTIGGSRSRQFFPQKPCLSNCTVLCFSHRGPRPEPRCERWSLLPRSGPDISSQQAEELEKKGVVRGRICLVDQQNDFFSLGELGDKSVQIFASRNMKVLLPYCRGRLTVKYSPASISSMTASSLAEISTVKCRSGMQVPV